MTNTTRCVNRPAESRDDAPQRDRFLAVVLRRAGSVATKALRADVWGEIDRLWDSLPAGVFTTDAFEADATEAPEAGAGAGAAPMAATASARGRSSDERSAPSSAPDGGPHAAKGTVPTQAAAATTTSANRARWTRCRP